MTDNRTLEDLKADYIFHIQRRCKALGHRKWKLQDNMLALYRSMFDQRVPLSVIFEAIRLALYEDKKCDPIKILFIWHHTMERYITRVWNERKFVEMDPFEDIPKREI